MARLRASSAALGLVLCAIALLAILAEVQPSQGNNLRGVHLPNRGSTA